MVIGKIHPGSGIGDQLFSYIITRVIALDKGYDFGFVGKEFFKGKDFMNLDWGKDTDLRYSIKLPEKALIITGKPLYMNGEITWAMDKPNEFKFDEPYYDPEVNFIQDGTVIDGYGAQDERYWGHRLDEIGEWLKVEAYDVNDKCCIVNFRGGEYTMVKDLFLPKSYWTEAMGKLGNLDYQVHTDDIPKAHEFFQKKPEYLYFQDIGLNWRSIRYAKNAIISNSAFAIIPRLLKHLEDPEAVTIAPFGWNARNASLTEWKGRPQNYYKKFTYI